MKYLLYRSSGSIEKDVTKHELVAVEFGTDIYLKIWLVCRNTRGARLLPMLQNC